MNLAHNEHDIKEMKRRISANRLNGSRHPMVRYKRN